MPIAEQVAFAAKKAIFSGKCNLLGYRHAGTRDQPKLDHSRNMALVTPEVKRNSRRRVRVLDRFAGTVTGLLRGARAIRVVPLVATGS